MLKSGQLDPRRYSSLQAKKMLTPSELPKESEAKEKKTDNLPFPSLSLVASSEKSSEKPIFGSRKSAEILSHLHSTIFVSALCLLILGGIYYWEQKTGWIEKIDSQAKNVLTNWDWKL